MEVIKLDKGSNLWYRDERTNILMPENKKTTDHRNKVVECYKISELVHFYEIKQSLQ